MAASFQITKLSSNVLKLSRIFLTLKQRFTNVISNWNRHTELRRYYAFKNCVLLSLVPFATVSADSDNDKPFEPDDVRLRSSECLKNASGLAVDSTSAVLSQTVYAIIKVEKEYVELLNVLVTLLEYQTQVLGQKAEEERIGDIILEARHEINKVKKRKQDLALLFASVEKLADATAEVAFAAGSNYASTSAGERLYSAQQEVKRNWAESERAEKDVAYAEAQMIDRVTRYEKMKARRQKRDDNGSGSNSNLDDLNAVEVEGGETSSSESENWSSGETEDRRNDFDFDTDTDTPDNEDGGGDGWSWR